VPRRINLLCDRALLGAYATDNRQIGPAMVDKAASEVFDMQPPAPRTTPPPGSALARHPWLTLALGALGGAVVVAGMALILWQQRPAQPALPGNPPAGTAPAAQPQTSPPATALLPASSEAAPVPAAAPAPLTSPPGAADLLSTSTAAWRELGPLWGEPLTGGDACTVALQNRLQCFTTQRMTLHGLRQLNRPGILRLHLSGEGTRQALVVAMTAETVTLQANGQRWLMPLTALADIWRGDYATLWRQPEGAQGRISQNTRGSAPDWLARQLAALQVRGVIPAEASTLAARLKAFQRTQGLEVDGVAGPMSYMQVNLAMGVDEPHLSQP
jgi:general secretion pathway protein A